MYLKKIKDLIKKNKTKKLSANQIKQIKDYYEKRGYKRVNSYSHQFYTAVNNTFSVRYIPEDMFHSFLSKALNESKQWPALLDKNLLEVLLRDFKQPESIVKNINGFYYINNRKATIEETINICNACTEELVIKPSIESGGGRQIIGFSINNGVTTYQGLNIVDLLKLYHKDFIIQKVVCQQSQLKTLNPSSLNTLRIMSYRKDQEVHILSSIIRIGKTGSFTDNNSSGGMVCGIHEDGRLHEYGYFAYQGLKRHITDSKVVLKDVVIPNYDKLFDMVREMHFKIPYFKIVSWDIGIDDTDSPVLIEYNTYHQGIGVHQITNGPLFGEFTDEILEICKDQSLN